MAGRACVIARQLVSLLLRLSSCRRGVVGQTSVSFIVSTKQFRFIRRDAVYNVILEHWELRAESKGVLLVECERLLSRASCKPSHQLFRRSSQVCRRRWRADSNSATSTAAATSSSAKRRGSHLDGRWYVCVFILVEVRSSLMIVANRLFLHSQC